MKSLFHIIPRATLSALVLMIGLSSVVQAQDPRIQMAQLDHLAAKASETVDVSIDERLVRIAIKVFNDKDPDEAKVKQLISNLKGIYVKRFEFDADNMFSSADIDTIRNQLREPLWTRLVGVKSKRDSNVEVYISLLGSNINGLALITSEPRELTVVNIVGPVDLEKLADLEGNLGIPVLDVEIPKKIKNEKE